MGRPEYQPKRNMGVYYIRLVIIGPSDRSVSGALDNLRATEDTIRDKTGPARRSVFVHSWRLLWLAEDVCVEDALATDPVTKKPLLICGNRTVDVFSVSFCMPLYQCPQNSYKDSALGRCMSCASEKTSATASTSPNQCLSCQPNYDDVTQRFEYTYLKCDGRGCNQCPPNTLSSPGALGLKDCVVQPTISVTLKGPSDAGSTSESVTAHRFGRPYHKPFDVERFRQIITMVSGVNTSRVVLGAAKDVWNYPASRCTQLRGGCKFEVSIQLQAESALQLVTALQRMVGHTHTYTHTHNHTNTHTHTHIQTHTLTHKYTRKHTHTHANTHTHIHTHTHTHTRTLSLSHTHIITHTQAYTHT